MTSSEGARVQPGTNTVGEVLRLSTEHLAAKGSETPRLDAERLLAKALDVERIDLYMAIDRPLTPPSSMQRGLSCRAARGGSRCNTSSVSGVFAG